MAGQSNTMRVFDFDRFKKLREQTFHRALQDQDPDDAAKTASMAVNALAHSEHGSEAIEIQSDAESSAKAAETERKLKLVPAVIAPRKKPARKRKITDQMPVVESVPKAGISSFNLADSDPQIDDTYEEMRQNAQNQMRNDPAPPKAVVEIQLTKPETPKPAFNARKYNPQIWGLLDFWLENRILTKDEIIQLVRSISQCIVNIPVSDATVDELHSILEDEETAKLVEKERQYWLEMPVKQMSKWEWLYTEGYFHPLFSPEDEFPPKVVQYCLLLLYAFRQHYPTPHWTVKLLRNIFKRFSNR